VVEHETVVVVTEAVYGAPALALWVDAEGRCESGTVVVRVAGELDMLTTPALRRLLVGMVSSGRTRVVLALDRVTFLDCSGLGELLAVRNQLQDRAGELVLSSPADCVVRLLEWTGTHGCITVERPP
jgi:anti-anti-sigma factor